MLLPDSLHDILKQRTWWLQLEPQWQLAFQETVLGHKNAPTDDELQNIGSLTVLRLVGPSAPFPNMTFELTNLSGLSHLTNLEMLFVTHHAIHSLKELEKLDKLTKLFINEMRKTIPVPVIHIWQKDNGYQRTIILNEAVRASSGEYMVQVDGDIVLHPAFLKDHIKVAEKGFFVKGSRCLLNKQTTQEALNKNRIRFNIFSSGISNRLNALRIPFASPLLRPACGFPSASSWPS